MMNNYFFVTHEVIRQLFSLMTLSHMKIIAESHNQKIVTQAYPYMILYFIIYLYDKNIQFQ